MKNNEYSVIKTSYEFLLKHRKNLAFFWLITMWIPWIILGFHPNILPDLTNMWLGEKILTLIGNEDPTFMHRIYDVFYVWSTIWTIILGELVTLYLFQYHKKESLELSGIMKWYFYKIPKLIFTKFLFWLSILARSLLLIIPGIFYSILWLFTTQVVLYYDIFGLKAMKKSKTLVQWRRWETFGRNVGYTIIVAWLFIVPMTLFVVWYIGLYNYPIVRPIIDTIFNLIQIPILIFSAVLMGHFFLIRDKTSHQNELSINESSAAIEK